MGRKLAEATKSKDKMKTPHMLNEEAKSMNKQMTNEKYGHFYETFVDANPYNPFCGST